MWVKNDMLGIIKELRERIPVPLASDVIEKILRDAIQKSIDWQIIKVGKSPNERDINIRVIFSLSVKLPNVSADNLSDNATKNIGNMTKKLIQRIDLKPYTAGFAYDLTYFDTNIVDDEIDTDSFHWEEVK